MDKPAAFQATFSDFKLVKTRKVAQFVLEVPLEQADHALSVVGGLPNGDEKWVGVALLKPGAKPVTPDKPSPAQEAYQAKGEAEKAVARAAIMCGEPNFQLYAIARMYDTESSAVRLSNDPKVNEHNAAQFIRSRCGVQTRAAIAASPEALKAFLFLEAEYRSWQRYGESQT